jgi:hypothetical protein
MGSEGVGLKDCMIVGLIMGLLKFASMRALDYSESDLAWWESYGIWTVLSLLSIAIHVGLQHLFKFRSSKGNATPFNHEATETEAHEVKD